VPLLALRHRLHLAVQTRCTLHLDLAPPQKTTSAMNLAVSNPKHSQSTVPQYNHNGAGYGANRSSTSAPDKAPSAASPVRSCAIAAEEISAKENVTIAIVFFIQDPPERWLKVKNRQHPAMSRVMDSLRQQL
jgi:hypothetical protein